MSSTITDSRFNKIRTGVLERAHLAARSNTPPRFGWEYTLNTLRRGAGRTTEHPFHLVDQSPWPLFISIVVFNALFGVVAFMHDYTRTPFAANYTSELFEFILIC